MAKPMKLDEALIEKLASIHCTNKEIASIVGCSVDTLDRRFADLIAKGKDQGRSTLRRLQFQLAQKGNATMLIWLGKQILGQREPQATETLAAAGFKIVVEDYTK